MRDLIDAGPQAEFDALVALAANMLDVPTAMLTLLDGERIRVQAKVGSDVTDLPRELAFCDDAIRAQELLVLEDALQDKRFARHPLVAREGGIRFYAGLPLNVGNTETGTRTVGVLCVADDKPRCLSENGLHALRHFATLAEAMLAARVTTMRAIDIATEAERLATNLAQKDRVFRQAERMAMIGSWRLSLDSNRLDWSEGVARIHGLPADHMPRFHEALNYYPIEARARISEALVHTIETGEPFEIEEDLIAADGRVRRICSHAELERVNGMPVALIGAFQDITERHALEMALRHSADTDALTGLANRAAFDRELSAAMHLAKETASPLLLALIDLDGFKTINDTLGHTAGDDVLRRVGETLRADWLQTSFAARLGGDEFAVIVTDPALVAVPELVAERIEAALRRPVQMGAVTLASGGTVGVALLEEHDSTLRDFVHHADTVLYAAKRSRIGNRNGDRRSRTTPPGNPGRRAGDRCSAH